MDFAQNPCSLISVSCWKVSRSWLKEQERSLPLRHLHDLPLQTIAPKLQMCFFFFPQKEKQQTFKIIIKSTPTNQKKNKNKNATNQKTPQHLCKLATSVSFCLLKKWENYSLKAKSKNNVGRLEADWGWVFLGKLSAFCYCLCWRHLVLVLIFPDLPVPSPLLVIPGVGW